MSLAHGPYEGWTDCIHQEQGEASGDQEDVKCRDAVTRIHHRDTGSKQYPADDIVRNTRSQRCNINLELSKLREERIWHRTGNAVIAIAMGTNKPKVAKLL